MAEKSESPPASSEDPSTPQRNGEENAVALQDLIVSALESTRSISDNLRSSIATLQNFNLPATNAGCQSERSDTRIPLTHGQDPQVQRSARIDRLDDILTFGGSANHLRDVPQWGNPQVTPSTHIERQLQARQHYSPHEHNLYSPNRFPLVPEPSTLSNTHIIISNKKKHREALRIILAFWYIITLLVAPIVLISFGGITDNCGTNAGIVHGIGDSSNTLQLWIAYMVLLTAIDLPRVPLTVWAHKQLATIAVVQQDNDNNNPSNLQTLRKRAAKVIQFSVRPLATILWILIVLWLMAGTVWLAASTCQPTNPHLYTFCFFMCCALWTVGISWYILSRWRAWYVQALQIEREQRRVLQELRFLETQRVHQDGMQPYWYTNSGVAAIVANAERAESRSRALRLAQLGQGSEANWYSQTQRGRDTFAVDGITLPRGRPARGSEDLDPYMLAMLNGATSDFWTPVDPVRFRATGEGVAQEEWDQMRVYRFEKTIQANEKGHEADDEESIEEKGKSRVVAADSIATFGGGQIHSIFEGCIICMSEFESGDIVRELQCSHAFHEECISRWMKSIKEGGEGKRTCPLCVAEVSRK
ncbi:E3 ubiquitin-protein ligase rnf38 [Chytriomyces hyalinus]|nr:E3 ubiquitin-protein ligase rnf38 [Chytriomyces hyalinus]